jgi:hypothetical protein
METVVGGLAPHGADLEFEDDGRPGARRRLDSLNPTAWK